MIVSRQTYQKALFCTRWMAAVLFLCFFSPAAHAISPVSSSIQFIENKGQWESNILFRSELEVGTLFIEKSALTYMFIDNESIHNIHLKGNVTKINCHAVKISFEDAGNRMSVEKADAVPEYYNYYTGNDRSHWASHVNAFRKVTLKNIYNGIDLELVARNDKLKMNFIVSAGADPSKIRLKYEGADQLFIDQEQLRLITSLGEITEEKPVSFQSINQVEYMVSTRFQLNGNVLSYVPAKYNRHVPLIIDPSIVFGSYTGSHADNWGFTGTHDKWGYAYGGGTVYNTGFPVTTGAYSVTFKGGSTSSTNAGDIARDVGLVKFNPTGTQLIYATYLGGTGNEEPHSLDVNDSGELLVLGTTTSYNFPTTQGAFDETYNGNGDIFISKFSPDGSTLIASTFFGGYELDGVNGEIERMPYSNSVTPLAYNYADWFRGDLLNDHAGNIYFATTTRSKETDAFPLINADKPIFGGGLQDGVLVKMRGNLSTVSFSTYVGGNGDDACYGLILDNVGNMYVAGGTMSNNLPYTSLGNGYKGSADGFVARYTSAGVLSNLAYVGTTSFDQCFFVDIDVNKNVYVLGQSEGDMGYTPGVYHQPNGKQFIRIYDRNLALMKTSTVFGTGGSYPDLSPSAFMVDDCGRVFVAGWGGSVNIMYNWNLGRVTAYPTTPDAFQKTTDGSDFYLMQLSPGLKSLKYATFYGGDQSAEHVDGGTSHFDKSSSTVYQAVCAGCWQRSDFPTTPGAYSRVNPSFGCNLGIFKFDMHVTVNPPMFRDTLVYVEAGNKLDFIMRMTDPDRDSISFILGSSLFATTANIATVTDTIRTPGLTTAILHWQTNCSDASTDTQYVSIFMSDDACPTPQNASGLIKIVVRSSKVPPPFPACLKIVDDNEVKLEWQNGLIPPTFRAYRIIKSSENGPSSLFDTITDVSITSRNDKSAVSHLTKNYCYEMYGVNTCGVIGDTSRTVCSVYKGDTITDPGFIGVEDTLIVLHAMDTLEYVFKIYDTDARDSDYVNVELFPAANNRITSRKIDMLGSASVSLEWFPGCSDISADTQVVYVFVHDNQCPQARSKTKAVRMLVLPPSPAEPPAMKCVRKVDDHTVLLRWNPITPKTYTKYFHLLRSAPGSSREVMSSPDFSVTEYTDATAVNNESVNYCYSITTTDVCKYYGDTSADACSVHPDQLIPKLQWYTVTVNQDKEIRLVWFASSLDSFWRYTIFRKTDRASVDYEQIASIDDKSDTVFTDREVKVDEHSYCYMVVNTNDCGLSSVKNNEACSILLTGVSIPFRHTLTWQPYMYWSAGVTDYTLRRTEPGWYSDSTVAKTTFKGLSYPDEKLNYDNGLYSYKVTAKEGPGGFEAESESNVVDLVQAPIVYVPNAFTANNDGVNDTWQTLPVFVKDFHLKLFNRWGELIWETMDKKASFTPLYRDEPAPEAVYFYILDYTGWDGSSHTKKGNVTLLR